MMPESRNAVSRQDIADIYFSLAERVLRIKPVDEDAFAYWNHMGFRWMEHHEWVEDQKCTS